MSPHTLLSKTHEGGMSPHTLSKSEMIIELA